MMKIPNGPRLYQTRRLVLRPLKVSDYKTWLRSQEAMSPKRDTGELVGFVDICTILRDPYQMANLGYFISNDCRGRGYAREALRAIIPAAFRNLGFHRLEASIDMDNRASIALAKKAGLHREGVKKHYWFQNGRWEDQVVFVAVPELFR